MKTWVLWLVCLLAGCGGGDGYRLDPLEKEQWYLRQLGFEYHSNINLPSDFPYKGRGITIAIVDDGVDIEHEDLSDNVGYGNFSYLPIEYNFSNANHGTSVAGIIAAVEGNGLGGRGVAPKSTINSFNALRAPATKNLADALVRRLDLVDVSNNSWGDFNSWGEPLHLKAEIEGALEMGTTRGRSGKGVVYVFSAGNGALIDGDGVPFDNVNYSGLVNNRYTLPVCAVDHFGIRTGYSEAGATLLICAPSKGGANNLGVVSTDVTGDFGYNSKDKINDFSNVNYTKLFGGTSAAAPMVTGVVALILEANPRLSWRDVRKILAMSAKKNDPANIDWVKNGAGLWVSHSYGFGVVDAAAAVGLALNWKKLPSSKSVSVEKLVSMPIPDNDSAGLVCSITVDESMRVEFVDIYFDAPGHPKVGDLEVVLVSPSGTKSILSEIHNQAFGVFRYNNWRFGSIRHLGEGASGEWKLMVRDMRKGNVGVFVRWKLEIHGY